MFKEVKISKKKLLLLKNLKSLSRDTDKEHVHIEADDLLLEYIGDDSIKRAFLSLELWYS